MKKTPLLAVTAFLLITICFASCGATYVASKDAVTVTVTDKERVQSAKTSTYLVFTEHETFENSDSLLFGKWNSSDVYGALREGETYEFTVVGWRVPILSWYRNIISYRSVR